MTKSVTKSNNNVQTAKEIMPDYIKQGTNRGNENVTANEIQLPRIDIIQGLSPQIQKKKDQYIDGAEVGDLFNTLTNSLYGGEVIFVPVSFKVSYLVWIDRKKDSAGGLCGVFDTQEEAEKFVANPETEDSDKMEIVTTHEHLVLLDNGEEVIISMAKSKGKVSRKLNSLVRLAGGDRFSRSYVLSTVEDSSRQGEFMNFSVTTGGFPSQALYEKAEKLYEEIARGAKTINTSYEEDTSDVEFEDEQGEAAY